MTLLAVATYIPDMADTIMEDCAPEWFGRLTPEDIAELTAEGQAQ